MKKLAIIAVLSALLGVSCATFPPRSGTVIDDTIAPEETATIYFMFFRPDSYMNNPVNRRRSRLISVPAGDAQFTGEIKYRARWGGVRVRFREKDARFVHEFEGGKEYWAIVDFWNGRWGLNLYEEEIKKRISLPLHRTHIGFFPFDPPVVFR
jgi:hypothetical protein